MTAEIFDGRSRARVILRDLEAQVAQAAVKPAIVDIYWREDPSSVFYAQYKKKRALEVGIAFEAREHSFSESLIDLVDELTQANQSDNCVGIMLQRPAKKRYNDYFLSRGVTNYLPFAVWWNKLLASLRPEHDVDGLSPLWYDSWRAGEKPLLFPATVKAVLLSLEKFDLSDKKILVIGRSDILGLPLTAWWTSQKYQVTNVGRLDLNRLLSSRQKLCDFDVIVSAAGQANLIRGDMIKNGAILVDVGEPKPDFDQKSCIKKAAFITPVPGGIGPLTVASLLTNSLILSQNAGHF